jgi:hypothetical protein
MRDGRLIGTLEIEAKVVGIVVDRKGAQTEARNMLRQLKTETRMSKSR